MSNIFDDPEVLARIDKFISHVKENHGATLTYEDVLQSISKLFIISSCAFCREYIDTKEHPILCKYQNTCSANTIVNIVCGGKEVDNCEEILKKAKKDAEAKLVEKEKETETEAPHSPDLMVEKPPHYTSGAIECIDAIAAAIEELQGIEAFDTANAIKYLWRWKRKNGKQDLEKARWYVNHLITHLEKAGEDENE